MWILNTISMVNTIPVIISTTKVINISVGYQEKVRLVLAQTDMSEATEQIRMKCLTEVLLNQATPVVPAKWATSTVTLWPASAFGSPPGPLAPSIMLVSPTLMLCFLPSILTSNWLPDEIANN